MSPSIYKRDGAPSAFPIAFLGEGSFPPARERDKAGGLRGWRWVYARGKVPEGLPALRERRGPRRAGPGPAKRPVVPPSPPLPGEL